MRVTAECRSSLCLANTLIIALILLQHPGLAGTQASLCSANTTFPCYCDAKCGDFKDCCPSAMPDGLAGWPAPDPNQVLPSCTKSSSLRLSIRQFFPDCYSTFVYVFDKCPRDFDDGYVRRQCEEFGLDQSLAYEAPVASKDGRLFRNRFCAACNSYPDHLPAKVVYFRSYLNLKRQKVTRDRLISTIKQTLTRVYFSVPLNAIRICFRDEVSRCPASADSAQAAACERGPTNRLTCGKQVFRNRACVQCSASATAAPCGGPPERTCNLAHLLLIARQNYLPIFDDLGLLEVPTVLRLSPRGGANGGEAAVGLLTFIVMGSLVFSPTLRDPLH